MKILALEHELPGGTAEKFQQHARAEAARAWDLHQQGIIRELYFRADRTEAILTWNVRMWIWRRRPWLLFHL